jgi:hypothetical protein
MLGYRPGSILLTDNQGDNASLAVLINPEATAVPEPSTFALAVFSLLAIGSRRRVKDKELIPKPPPALPSFWGRGTSRSGMGTR